MQLRLTKFSGIAPKQTDLNLEASFAVIAENVNLERGSIQAWNLPHRISENSGDSIYVEDCCVITGDCDARFAKTGIDCDSILAATGVGQGPMFTTQCPPKWEPLGFPCDMAAPSVTAPPAKDGLPEGNFSLELRAYYYTVENRMGWESQPSLPSNWLRTNTLAEVSVSGFDIPNNATAIHIYRAQSPLDFDGELQMDDSAIFLHVGTIPVTQTVFKDTIKVAGDACLTEQFDAPPSNLREICSWREGRLAGLTGDHFIMTERSAPHAWNRKFLVGFYDKPIALQCSDRTAYVLTDGRPAALELRGDCADGESPIVVHEILTPLPIVSRRSAAIHMGAVIYASRMGLVLIHQGRASVITSPYYTEDQWQQLLPHTMVGEVCDGVYYGATKNTTIRLDLPDEIFSEPGTTALTTLTLRPRAMHTAENGRLYMSLSDGTYEWNTGEDKLTYRWRGKVQDTKGKVRMSAFNLRTSGNVKVTHFVDTSEIQNTEAGNKHVRLPVGYAGEDWQVQLEGKSEIKEYTLATSVRELS